MPCTIQLNSSGTEASKDMGHVLGQEWSSGQQKIVDSVIEKTPPPWIEKATLFQEKHRVRHSFSQSYLDREFESTEIASAEKVRSRSGFLRQVEKEKPIQGKALNFGVLDWKHLEKWKYTERMPASHSRSLSYSGNQPAANDSRFRSPQQLPAQCLNFKSLKYDRNGSCRKEEVYVECLKSEIKETCSQKYRTEESIKNGRQQNHFQQIDKYPDQIYSEANAYKSKRNPKRAMVSEREAYSSLSKQGKHKIALRSPKKVSAQGKKNVMRFDEVKLTSECSLADPQDIVLLVPNDIQKNYSESFQITESKASLDAPLPVATQSRFSDFCSPRELYSQEYAFEIPHTSPLPTVVVDPCNLSASRATDTGICSNADSITSISSEAIFSDMSEETTRPGNLVEASNRKQADFDERPVVKGRSPSPTRRFSFDL